MRRAAQLSVDIAACAPSAPPARAMQDALWAEIQRRYDFTAPDPIDRSAFDGPRGAFWVASHDGRPVGSIALAPLDHPEVAELDVMYVAPDQRGTGLARALLATLEDHARGVGIRLVRLRAGEPQPEALRFYVCGRLPTHPAVRQVGRRRHGPVLREGARAGQGRRAWRRVTVELDHVAVSS